MNAISRMTSLVLTLLVLGCSREHPRTAVSESTDSEPFIQIDSEDPFSDDSLVGDKAEPIEFDDLVALIERTVPIEESKKAKPLLPPPSPEQLLDAIDQVVHDVLTNSQLKDNREFYGTPNSRRVVLVNDSALSWPDDYEPKVDGFDVEFSPENRYRQPDQDRILGIRLHKVDLRKQSTWFLDGDIAIILLNAGGDRNGIVEGGCIIYYTVDRQGDTVTARFTGLMDP